MPARVLRGFLLIGPSFAEKRVWFSQELPNFLQKYVAYTILSRKTCDGEQTLFWELIFMLMPTRVSRRFLLIGPSFAENVYGLAKNFQIFFKNMLLTLLYLERHVMESKNYFWELIFTLMPTRVSRRFLLIGPSFAEKRVWFSQELPNFLQKYVAYTILSRKTCNGEKKLFWELIFILMPTRVLRGFLLKNVYDLAKNFQIFFKNMLLTLFYLERHVMESKNYFWEWIFTLDTLVGINMKINSQK